MHACMRIVEKDRKREELREEEGGSGLHLASGGEDEARVSAEEAEIVLERTRRGRGRNGSVFFFGWVGCLGSQQNRGGREWSCRVEYVRRVDGWVGI
jgi:hypothetical protein